MSKETKLAKGTIITTGKVAGWGKDEVHTLINLKGVHIYVESGHPLENLKVGETVSFTLES